MLKLRKNKRRSHYIILSLSIRSDKPNSVDEIDVCFHLKKINNIINRNIKMDHSCVFQIYRMKSFSSYSWDKDNFF